MFFFIKKNLKKNQNLSGNMFLGYIYMKIVFLLNQEKKYYFLAFINKIFPRLVEIYFAGLRGRKILQEINIQKGLTKT